MDIMAHQYHGNGNAAQSIQFKDSLCRTVNFGCDLDGPRERLQCVESSCGRIASRDPIAAFQAIVRRPEIPFYARTAIEIIVYYRTNTRQ
jgi:hypothetical protein